MPELPEVQLQVDLLQVLRGQKITAFRVLDPKIRLPRRLIGQVIRRIRRFGKFIIFDLSGGDHLLAHLRMTGWFELKKPARYRAAMITDRSAVYFTDSRRFGVLSLLTDAELDERLAKLGPDPLDRGFQLTRLQQSSRPIKLVLLDQQRVAGVGNIYASESLWLARIDPRRRANRLKPGEWPVLQQALRRSLRKAIGYGPKLFSHQHLNVYDREGKPCRRCGAAIRRITQGQRSTFFCATCQK